MESLAEETWDVVIAGTGLVQALLALSLSRSDLKILHVDENSYYGGTDAGLSLEEAKSWAERHKTSDGTYSLANITQLSDTKSKLAASRTYTLSLNPQIIYAQSTFLPSLVSSTVNAQLEFLAVGSWWLFKDNKLQKVPSTREDVFADDSLSRRDKMGLMKFLRYVMQDDTEAAETQEDTIGAESLRSALTSKFKISPTLQMPISALALAQNSTQNIRFESAVSRIRRHMKSMGYFGPGFGAVVSKYAGNAEIAQVCCRACAVGGATYLLGQGVSDVAAQEENDTVAITLAGGVTVKAKNFVCNLEDLPAHHASKLSTLKSTSTSSHTYHSITVVSSGLRHLFPQTSENGPTPAAAIVLVNDSGEEDALLKPPIYLQVHSEDTGECPSGQCIIYASTLHPEDEDLSLTSTRLTSAVKKFLEAPHDNDTAAESNAVPPEILWSMSYVSRGPSINEGSTETFIPSDSERIMIFPPRAQDIAFDDSISTTVKTAWQRILGGAADGVEFLRFEDRSEQQDDGD